jgi:hypothetical protein
MKYSSKFSSVTLVAALLTIEAVTSKTLQVKNDIINEILKNRLVSMYTVTILDNI